MSKLATSPLPYRGAPPLESGGQNQKWPTSGRNGYLTLAVSGIPTAAERGAKSEVAHKWATWLRHPCRLGDPGRFKAGSKIRNVQKKGGNATSPLHCGGSLAKGTKSKVAELGQGQNLYVQSKRTTPEKNRTNDVCASKNTLKTPPRTILKKGWGFENPPRYRISQKPPPWGHMHDPARGTLTNTPPPLVGIPPPSPLPIAADNKFNKSPKTRPQRYIGFGRVTGPLTHVARFCRPTGPLTGPVTNAVTLLLHIFVHSFQEQPPAEGNGAAQGHDAPGVEAADVPPAEVAEEAPASGSQKSGSSGAHSSHRACACLLRGGRRCTQGILEPLE